MSLVPRIQGPWRWLFYPLIGVAVAVLLGYFLTTQPEVTQNDSVPMSSVFLQPPHSPPQIITVSLKDSFGQPASDAVAVLLQPELARAAVDVHGKATFLIQAHGPVHLMASLSHHELLHFGPADAFPLDGLEFTALKEKALLQYPLTLRKRNVTVQTVPPVQDALLTAKADGPPWMAWTNQNGVAIFKVLPEIPLNLAVYAPGFPSVDAWEIGTADLEKMGTSITIPTQSWPLSLRDLPANELASIRRTHPPAEMPDHWVDEMGTLFFPNLPAGEYKVSVQGLSISVKLPDNVLSGTNR